MQEENTSLNERSRSFLDAAARKVATRRGGAVNESSKYLAGERGKEPHDLSQLS